MFPSSGNSLNAPAVLGAFDLMSLEDYWFCQRVPERKGPVVSEVDLTGY